MSYSIDDAIDDVLQESRGPVKKNRHPQADTTGKVRVVRKANKRKLPPPSSRVGSDLDDGGDATTPSPITPLRVPKSSVRRRPPRAPRSGPRAAGGAGVARTPLDKYATLPVRLGDSEIPSDNSDVISEVGVATAGDRMLHAWAAEDGRYRLYIVQRAHTIWAAEYYMQQRLQGRTFSSMRSAVAWAEDVIREAVVNRKVQYRPVSVYENFETPEDVVMSEKVTGRDLLKRMLTESDNTSVDDAKPEPLAEFRQRDRRIKVTYEIVTPESASEGDFADSGWENEEGILVRPDEYDIDEWGDESGAAVAEAVKVLRNAGATEASSSSFHPGVWYSTPDGNQDMHTGEYTFYSYHLDGFTPQEERSIFQEIARR